MICKWFSVILSLLLAFMIPVAALADTRHDLTIIPGEMIASEEAIADFLDVFSLTLTTGEESGALTLNLADTAIATAALSADSSGLYVQSNLLSDDVLYITWDDGFAFVTDLLKASMASEGVDEASIEVLESTMAEAKDSIVTALGTGVAPAVSMSPKTTEEALAQAQEMFKDDPEMLSYINSVMNRMVIEDGLFTDEERDAADQKYSMVMTGEDLTALCDTQYLRKLIEEAVLAENPELSGDALAKATDDVIAEVRSVYENSDMNLTLDMYTLENGTVLVGMDMVMQMTIIQEEYEEKTLMNFNYDRLSTAEGIAYKADMSLAIDGEEVMQVVFDLTKGSDAVSKGKLAMLVEGEEMSVMYRAENTQPDVRDRSIALYFRSGATAIIDPAPSDRPVISFRVVTSPETTGLLHDIEHADASNSVNVMKLSDEEMQALIGEISTRCMQVVYAALAKLPTSVLSLVMEMQ